MKILLLSPHTDDVELGCGGSVARFSEEGNELRWMVFSTAEDSLPIGAPKDTLLLEYKRVLETYGIGEDQSMIFNFKVRGLHQYRQEVLEHLVEVRNQFHPDLVIGPSLNDYHQDHQVVANEMIRAFKTSSSIISYELPWNHVKFDTQLFVRLNRKHIEKKWKVLQNYRSQVAKGRDYFSEDFVFGMAKMRGVQCTAEYAEAFEVTRWRI
jgi:N-acetylglucosamine malate deacetylase 1